MYAQKRAAEQAALGGNFAGETDHLDLSPEGQVKYFDNAENHLLPEPEMLRAASETIGRYFVDASKTETYPEGFLANLDSVVSTASGLLDARYDKLPKDPDTDAKVRDLFDHALTDARDAFRQAKPGESMPRDDEIGRYDIRALTRDAEKDPRTFDKLARIGADCAAILGLAADSFGAASIDIGESYDIEPITGKVSGNGGEKLTDSKFKDYVFFHVGHILNDIVPTEGATTSQGMDSHTLAEFDIQSGSNTTFNALEGEETTQPDATEHNSSDTPEIDKNGPLAGESLKLASDVVNRQFRSALEQIMNQNPTNGDPKLRVNEILNRLSGETGVLQRRKRDQGEPTEMAETMLVGLMLGLSPENTGSHFTGTLRKNAEQLGLQNTTELQRLVNEAAFGKGRTGEAFYGFLNGRDNPLDATSSIIAASVALGMATSADPNGNGMRIWADMAKQFSTEAESN